MPKQSIIIETPLASIPIQTRGNPVDTAVAPVRKTGGLASELMQGLKGLNPAIQSYVELQEANVKANRDLGAMDRILKKTPNNPNSYRNLGWGYNQGYATLDGEIRGIDITQEYQEALEDANYFIDDPDPESSKRKRQELYDKISQKHLMGTTNVDVLAGASQRILKTAVDTEEEAYKRFHVAQYTTLLNNTRKQLSQTMVEARSSILKMLKLPPEKRNWAPIRQILTSTKQTLEASHISAADAASLTIDAYGEAIIGASQGNTRLAQTMLDILDLRDASGIVFARDVQKSEGGKLQYPLREQIATLRRDVMVAVEESKTIDKEAIKKQWANDSLELHKMIAKGTTFEDLNKKIQECIDYGADINPGQLINAWEQQSQGWDNTVLDDKETANELYHKMQSGVVISMASLRELNKANLLSHRSAMDIFEGSATYQQAARENFSIGQRSRELDEQVKVRLKDESERDTNSFVDEITVNNLRKLASGDAIYKHRLDIAKKRYQAIYDDAQLQNKTRFECRQLADRAASAVLGELGMGSSVSPEETDKKLNDGLDALGGAKWQIQK